MFKFTNLPWAQVSCHNRKLTLPTGYSVEGVVLDFSRGGGGGIIEIWRNAPKFYIPGPVFTRYT